jgi:hypothetical protein
MEKGRRLSRTELNGSANGGRKFSQHEENNKKVDHVV